MSRNRLEMIYPSTWWHDLWREGLVTGNGYTGANLYGGAKKEILQLGRHDFWYDGSEETLPDVKEAFVRLREKMDRKEYREASWEVVNALNEKNYGSRLESHMPAARIVVEQKAVEGFAAYHRSLDMEKALASAQWTDGGIRMSREVFVSRITDMTVYRIKAENAKGSEDKLEVLISLEPYQNEGEVPTEAVKKIWESAKKETVFEDPHTVFLYLNEETKDSHQKDMEFGAVAKVVFVNGQAEMLGERLKLSGADEIVIEVMLYVNEARDLAWKRLHDELAAQTQPFDALLNESAQEHMRLYHSAELELSGADLGRSNEELLMEAYQGKQSKEMIEKLWNFGRYLFICGTGPDANPFPLYGLWAGRYRPQWCHNMANENLQMVYWHSLCGNLAEYQKAIFRYMNDRMEAFRFNARQLFGIDGIYMTAGTTPGVASPTQVVPVIMNWVGAAGWIAAHYYDYFTYTKDWDYLESELLPYMMGVADFYEQFICFTETSDGEERIRIYPSVSPENTPQNFMPPEGVQMAHPMPTTVNSTIDLSIVKEFFSNMKKIADEMERCGRRSPFDEARIQRWNRILDAIPEFKVNEKGAIKEWQEDEFEDRYDHRHLSHIYPVFPGKEIYPKRNPKQTEAYEKAVKLREIDAQTGWSMSHMAGIYARFRDGKAAMNCLDNMAKSCLTNNFFTLHNDWRGMNISLTMDPAPVQMDANLGYVNAVQEMLLYAAPGYLALLPALEERLYAGRVKNFRYEDGYVDMRWDVDKGEFEAVLRPIRPHKVQIALPDFVSAVSCQGIDERCVVLKDAQVLEVTLDRAELKIAAGRERAD